MPPAQARSITRPPVEIFGRHPGYGFAGLGVNTAIGNFTQTAVDLSFPAGLLGLLDWQRTYNSHSGAIGALGPGWATSFSAHLVASAPQGVLHRTASPVTFYDEDGRVLIFTPAPGGGYIRPQDLSADLTQNADGSFTLTYDSGILWSFDASGRLSGRSLEGQQVSLDYGNDDLLLTAQHSTGRQLAYSYDANRRLTSVQASDGRVVSFGYGAGTVTDALLESVTLPGGGVFQFEASGSGQASQVSKITDPDGVVLVANSYDAASADVTSQQFPGGGEARFHYDATGVTTVTSEPDGAEHSFQADANGRLVALTDPGQHAATFSYDPNGYLTGAVSPGGTQLAETPDDKGNILTSTFGGATTAWTYDDASRVTSITSPTGGVTTFGYSGASHVPSQVTNPNGGTTLAVISNGLVTSRTDADGNTTTLGYDATGNLTSVTNPVGLITRFGYDQAGNRTQAVSPSGATRQWSYDGAGRVSSYTAPDGAVTQLGYSPAGRLLQQTAPGGVTTSYAYNAAGILASVTDPLGDQTSFGYDPLGNLTATTDPDGNVTQYAYNDLGQLAGITDAVGTATQFGYDADGNTTSIAAPAGTSTFGYDARGNNTSAVDPTGATNLYGYDAGDRLTSMTNPLGATLQMGYDAAGNLLTVTDSAGAAAGFAWTKAGRLTGTTDPLGRQTTATRDASGRVTTITDPQGGVTRYAYDPDGRKISETTPAGLVSSIERDPAGRVTATTDPRGWITRTVYNAHGQRAAVIAPSGAATRFSYDSAGQLTEVTDGNGSVARYGYDNAGRLVSITDPKGAVTRYVYDNGGHLISDTDPLGRTTQREYDSAGNLTAIIDAAGHAQHMAYDGDGRLTQWTADDTPTVTFAYDQAGHRTSMTDATGTTHYSYDSTGRLLTITEPDGGQITNSYDAAGQLASLSYPSGLTTSYTYNLNGQLTGLHDSRAGDAAYALDPDGRLLTEQLPGRQARRYEYDGGLVRRFAVISDDHAVAETIFAHDPDGRILTQHDAAGVREFRYDRAGQLVHVTLRGDGQPEETQLVYDAAGNRVSLRRGGTETRYTYDAADQLTTWQARGRRTEFSYDASGRLTGEAEGERHRQVSYNGFGWPVTVTRDDHGRRELVTATFDGDGLVRELVLTSQDDGGNEVRAASIRYRWSIDDIVPQVLAQLAAPELDNAEHDVPGQLSADFAYGYGLTFASDERAGIALHRDAYGSAIRTPDTQAWAQASHYDEFGTPRDDNDERARSDPREHGELRPVPSQQDRHGQPGTDDPPLPRFGYHGELALGPVIDLRARVYDTDLGRFTSRDPLLSGPPKPGQTANPYLYANNDPVNFTDPLGTLAVAPLGGGQFKTVIPATPAPPRSHATAVLTSAIALGAPGGDNTTLHTAATFAATDYLIDQIAAVHGLFPLDIGIEEKVPGSPKDLLWHGKPPNFSRDGKADIFLEYEIVLPRSVFIWEVKSAIKNGPYWATARAISEGQWYVNNFNVTQNVGPNAREAQLGPGMLTPLYVTLIPTNPLYPSIIVESLKNAAGAVIYDKYDNNRGFPVPIYVYRRTKATGKKSMDLYQIRGPVPAQAVQRQFELAAFSGLGVQLTTSPAVLTEAAGLAGLGAILMRIATEFFELGGAG